MRAASTKMPRPDPTKPLKNSRHELFATRLARGMTNGEAWKATVPFGAEYKGGANSLRVSGHRVAQRPEITARVAFLRELEKNSTQQADEPFSQADIIRLNLEVSEALETAYKAADAACVSPQKLETLKRIFAAHLGRQGKLDQPKDLNLGIEENSAAYDALLINMAKTCICPTT